jgi:hypothetical protein
MEVQQKSHYVFYTHLIRGSYIASQKASGVNDCLRRQENMEISFGEFLQETLLALQ